MKRNLLLLVSLFVGASAFAQWTLPTIDGAELKFSSTEVGDTTAYYLYNQEAGAFFTQGNDWGTRASWTTEFSDALKVIFTKYVAAEGDEWDGKTVLISDSVATKGAWYLLFIDGENYAYVDHGSQENYFWEITKSGDDTYRFFGASMNPAYNPTDYPECYFGVDASASVTAIFPLLDINNPNTDGPYYVDWKLIPVDGTDPEAMESFVEKINQYQNAASLLAAIQQAQESEYATDIAADIAAAQAVYDNSASTSAELAAATDAVLIALNYASVKGATEDNPKDATGFIKNNDFSAGNIDGWTCTFVSGTNATNVGYQSASYTNGEVEINQFIEAWAASGATYNPNCSHRAIGDAKLSQLMPGLPSGKYMFTCDAIASYQDDATIEVSGVELFATGGTLEAKQSIHTGNGVPEHYELVFINPGGDVELGLRTVDSDANWIAADNFTLTYYGELQDDPEKVLLDAAVAKCEAAIPEPEEVYANADVKAAYLDALEAAKAATEGYADCQTALEAAFADFQASVSAYATYVERIYELQEDITTHEYTATEADLLADYLMDDNEIEPDEDFPNGSYWYIVSNGTLDNDQLTAELAFVNDLFQTVVANSLNEGDDCTKLLVNPNFADASGKGWTKATGSITWTGGLIPNFPVAECYHSYFDIYQDVVAPDGIYAVSLNGFCRLDGGESEVPAEIYINSSASTLMNITDDKVSEEDANDGFNCYLSNGSTGLWTTNPIFEGATSQSPYDATDSNDGDGYYPNGMQGASVAFSADRFKATAYGLVSGGKMRVGVRNYDSQTVWALWGNFTLTYMGKNIEALNYLIDQNLEIAEPWVEGKFDKALKDALVAAIDAAKTAETGDEKYDALMTLIDAVNNAKSSVETYKAFNEDIETLTTALEDCAETAKEDAVTAASNLLDEVLEAYDSETATDEDIAAYSEKIAYAVAQLKIPATEPTDDNPLVMTDWIVNPTFDGDADGWTLESEKYTNMQYQSASYTGEATIEGFAEVWMSGAALGDSFIKQTIKYLPEGTYKLEADVNACDQVRSDDVYGAYLFAQEGEEEITDVVPVATGNGSPVHFELVFKKASGETDLTLGAMVKETNANWIGVDNFALSFFGKNSALIPTGINDVSELKPATSAEIYNLAGQRLSTLQKGINIIGGKKVLVK